MNLYARFASLAEYQPDRLAVETAKERLTYAGLDLEARRTAHRLRSAGVGAGDLVGLRLKDTPAHLAALLAVMRVGATVLPLDWRAPRAEFERVAGQFAPKIVLVDDAGAAGWSPAMFDIAAGPHRAPDEMPADDAPDRVMGLGLTSGTTGLPKAMVVTHDQIFARCMTRALEGMFERDDRFLTTLPLAYQAGREHAIALLLLGATVVMFPTLFAPQELVDAVNGRDITAFNLSPNMSRAVLGLKRPASGLLMPNVRVMVSTTGRLEPEERAALRRHAVPRLIDYYGSTGTGPITVAATADDTPEPSAAGRLAIGVEMQIVDADGRPVPHGEVGRIRVRGRAVAARMIGAAEDADEGFRDGWYYPGDLGRIGSRGILRLMGRSADLIKRGGLMVHAQEVEQVLRGHPQVVDAAVVGAPSAELGQEVVAFVEARAPLDPGAIVRFCRGVLAGYKVPARVEVVEALPRNAAGKVVKADLLKKIGY